MEVGLYIWVIGLAGILVVFGVADVVARIITRREYRSGYVDADDGEA